MAQTDDSASGGGPGSRNDVAGGKLVLEHLYELVRRVHSESLFTAYEAIAQPFDRTVWVRYYTELEALGLSQEADTRLREQIAVGGAGGLAIDFGELEDGAPFLVLKPPPKLSLRDWWSDQPKTAGKLARLGLELIELVDNLDSSRRSTVVLDRLFMAPGADVDLQPSLYSIGARPTRVEVREMTGLVRRDLVLSFPPESFTSANAEDEELETTPAADVYRISVILHELLTGAHPIFPEEKDVTSALAELVSEVGERPAAAKSGSWQLDALIASGLSLDPSERPTFAELSDALFVVGATGSEVVENIDVVERRSARARLLWRPIWLGRTFRYIVVALVLATVSLGTFLFTNRPPKTAAVLVTSDPPGVVFDLVLSDGSFESLGRTPFILEQQALDEPLSIRPVYEDGSVGAIQTVRPNRLEVYDVCRGIQVRFQSE